MGERSHLSEKSSRPLTDKWNVMASQPTGRVIKVELTKFMSLGIQQWITLEAKALQQRRRAKLDRKITEHRQI